MNGFLSLMLLQLLARLLTFTLNMLLYRIALLPSTVGRVQIQLDLTHQTLLFGAREGIRMALLRYKSTSSQPSPSPNTALSSKKGDLASAPTSTTPQTDGAPPLSTQGLINLAWIPLFIGFFLTLLYYIYHRSSYFYHPFTVAAEKVDDNDYMTTATIYYLISACVELAVEPAHALLTHHLLFAARSAVEGAAVLIKCLATFSLTWIALNQGKIMLISAAPLPS